MRIKIRPIQVHNSFVGPVAIATDTTLNQQNHAAGLTAGKVFKRFHFGAEAPGDVELIRIAQEPLMLASHPKTETRQEFSGASCHRPQDA
jgi:hypothetical protein